MQMKSYLLCTVAWMIFWAVFPAQAAAKKSTVEIACGDIVEGEFSASQENHYYTLTMAPGDRFGFSIVPIGDYLRWIVHVHEPSGNRIFGSTSGCALPSTTAVKTKVLSGRGTHKIAISNYRYCSGQRTSGVYTLHVGCTLRDGTVIKPGSPQTPPPTPTPTPSPKPTPPADFKGFPGLGPIDFAGIAFPKLKLDIPVEGTISRQGDDVFGYRFHAAQGDAVDLIFQRTAGNLNLVLVLLDERGRVVFQASLVASETLTSRLRLPTTGEYTLGVARVELLPPTSPSETSFVVEAASE
jgi:hypothetical protein